MSPFGVTPDDEPIDVAAVGADDVLVEQLRHALSPDSAVVWDDDDDELDPAFALLRALQLDVSGDYPVGQSVLPAGVTELLPRRRRLGRGATVAAVAAGVLSIAGVAAASAPGQPLAGVRHAISSAVTHAVRAITPDAPVGPAVEPTHRPSAKPTAPGDAVSAAARSGDAVRQITANLDRAAKFIDKGRYQPAKNQLDAAASKLRFVTDDAVKAGLQSRLSGLQSRLAAMPTAKPTHGPAGDKGKSKGADGDKGSHNGKGHVAVTHTPKPDPTKSERSGSSRHNTEQPTTAPATELPSGDGSKEHGNSH